MNTANNIMLGIVGLFVFGPVLRSGLQWVLGTDRTDHDYQGKQADSR
jgi:hypothetical protein